MAIEQLASQLNQQFQGVQTESTDYSKTGHHLAMTVPADQIVAVTQNFFDEGYFLESLSGVDLKEQFQVSYHFNRFDETRRILVRVIVSHENPVVPTVSHIFPSANWYEREAAEFFGFKFAGHPNLSRLILPEYSTYHPLRKDFKSDIDSVKEVQDMIELEETIEKLISPTVEGIQTKDYFVNMGPQHPSTHGVLRLMLHMKGESILGIDPVLGYAHRADEKMAEIGNYLQFWPNTGRIDYLSAMIYNWAWSGVVERALSIPVTERTEHIRLITAELNRISSHLLWLGTYLLDLGAFTPFLYCFADREKVLDLLEIASGERITFVYHTFGGVLYDVGPEFIDKTRAFIKHFHKSMKDYHKLLTKNVIFLNRTKGIGIITKEVARLYGATGPVARASGINYDIRKAEPFGIYKDFDFDVPLGENGDCYDRYIVRMHEMDQCLRLVEQGLDKLPDGPIQSKETPRRIKPEKGEYYQAVESARGEFGIYLVSDGTEKPYRVKLRTPCYSNLSLISEISKGLTMPDLVSILGSLDLVIPDVDR